eukprot:SAG31_NODE_16819_length_694_cov_1.300840_2_plen_59_part_00
MSSQPFASLQITIQIAASGGCDDTAVRRWLVSSRGPPGQDARSLQGAFARLPGADEGV